MKKLLTAGALAGALAFTPALAAPAHAGDHDDALLGLGLALALGTAVYVASEHDNEPRHYRHKHGVHGKAHVKRHIHDKHCNHNGHNKHKGHAHKHRDDYHGYKHGRQYDRDDRRGRYYNNRYHNDQYTRNHNRFDQRDARRIAKRHYDINVEKTKRVNNRIVVKGWDRRGMWTKISFHARTGEVRSITKSHRRG
ncbi:MAG: hypothetical protein ACPG06_04800 [Alphaproteobacteria bacterium]